MRQDFLGNKQSFLHNVLGRKTLDVMSGYMGKKGSIVLLNNFLLNDVFMKPKDVGDFQNIYKNIF
jgi:hypothetical protein